MTDITGTYIIHVTHTHNSHTHAHTIYKNINILALDSIGLVQAQVLVELNDT